MTAEDEAHLLSGVYALDALTPEEAAAIESAMRDSEELRGEVVGLVDTAVALGLAVPAVAPPLALRASLLAAVQDLPQLPAEPAAAAYGSTAPAVDTTAPPQPSRPEPAAALRTAGHLAPRRRRRLLRRPSVLLTAAAVAVLLFGGGVLVTSAVMEPQLEYSRIVAASDVRQADGPVDGGGTARVYWSASQGGTAVVLKDVDVPTGKVLQLWSLHDGVATSEGLYEPHADAEYAVLDGVPAAGEQLAVTVEPLGGSQQPTSAVIAEVPLAA